MNDVLSMPTASARRALLARLGDSSIDRYRQENPAADRWASEGGFIVHTAETQAKIFGLADRLVVERGNAVLVPFFDVLHAADRVASADMWLFVHEMYAQTLYLDGRDLVARDFKQHPDEGAAAILNLVPAHVGNRAARTIDLDLGPLVDEVCSEVTEGSRTGRGTVYVHVRREEDHLFATLGNPDVEQIGRTGGQPIAPFFFDGRDPAAFAWAMFELTSGRSRGIGGAPLGAGFYPKGGSLVRSMLLGDNPRASATAAARFNETTRRLWVPLGELRRALVTLN